MICIYCGSEMTELEETHDAYHCPECGANAIVTFDHVLWVPGDKI